PPPPPPGGPPPAPPRGAAPGAHSPPPPRSPPRPPRVPLLPGPLTRRRRTVPAMHPGAPGCTATGIGHRRGRFHPIGRRSRRGAQRPTDRPAPAAPPPPHPPPPAPQQVKAVSDLAGLRRCLGDRLGECHPAVPRDDLDSRMLAQPGLQGLAIPAREQVEHPPAFEIHQERAIPLPLADGPVVDADTTRN